jgi:hypothetical protein
VHPEPVLTPERETETGRRNVVTAIAATLRPATMVACPVLIATLLERTVALPATALLPSPLLLPRSCLLPRALGLLLLLRLLGALLWLLLSLLDPLPLLRTLLLSLLDSLLLWALLLSLLNPLLLLRSRLLSPLVPLLLSLLGPLLLLRELLLGLLNPLLLRPLLLGLLDPLLLLPWLLSLLGPRLLLWPLLLRLFGPLLLRVLLLCGRPCCLLLPLRLALFRLLFVLRVRREYRREKQNQGGCTCSSSELHPSILVSSVNFSIACARRRPVPLTMFHRFCRLGIGLGLVHPSIRVVGRRVKSVYLQRHCLRRIDHVVVGAGRYHDRISLSHRALLLLVEDELGLPPARSGRTGRRSGAPRRRFLPLLPGTSTKLGVLSRIPRTHPGGGGAHGVACLPTWWTTGPQPPATGKCRGRTWKRPWARRSF